MLRMRSLGFMLMAVFAFGMTVAASASAAPVWEQQSGGVFAGISTPVVVASKSVGNMTFSDSGLGITVECGMVGKGTVGSGSNDRVTEFKSVGCRFVTAGPCEASKPVVVSGANLVWVTELYEEAGKVRDRIASGGAGEPGFIIECHFLGIAKLIDKCTGPTNVGMTNAAGGVDEIFDAISPKIKCEAGGVGSGTITGTDLVENPASGAIRVS
jgi:hypothetical protein